MAQNPLLGSRISLISKKNIRYEGTLYSINESNATVALQNVRSYGTEGREKLDPEATFVAPQDSVHPYLLFRGCDIKDLHVHENASQQPPSDPAIMSSNAPPAAEAPAGTATPQRQSAPAGTQPAPASAPGNENEAPASAQADCQEGSDASQETGGDDDRRHNKQAGRGNQQGNRRPKKAPTNPAHQIGTGASLLNRKVRGNKDGALVETPADDFDFQSNLKEFDKEHEKPDDEAGDTPQPLNINVGVAGTNYEKDDFFDSISCDAIDRQAGIDNRLRGSVERSLNTETFGAVALNSTRNRRRRYGGRGGGRDGGSGRHNGGGRGGGGRGRGRGRGGRGRGRGRGRGNWDNRHAPTAQTAN